MDNGDVTSCDLPNEIWLIAIGLVGASEWKQLRLSCKRFNMLASPILFSTIYFELSGSSCDSLYSIASQPALSPCVKTLVLRRRRGYREFPDLESWISSTHQPGDPGHELAPLSEVNQNDNDNLLPYSEWMALSKPQKEVLYREYEADRMQMQDHIRDITNSLYLQGLGSGTLLTRAADAPVEQLCRALGKLSNLTAFKHEPGFIFDEGWGCRWRNLYFHPWALLGNTDVQDDEDVEVLQLSVVLRSLVRGRQGHRGLQSLGIYVGGPALWGPERLQHLWEGAGHETTRFYRRLGSTAAEADEEAFIDNTTFEQKSFYLRQLALMNYVFADLTYLDCSVSEDDEQDGSLHIAAMHLLGFLRATKRLEQVRLVFGRLVDGNLLLGHNDSTYVQGSITLLLQLAQDTPWTRIRNIELEIATNRTTLVKFLLAHKDTLRSLTLTRTTLVRLEDSRSTWESTLFEIAKALSLKTLTLSTLWDFVPQENGEGTRERTLFDPEAEVWRGKNTQYHIYYNTAVRCILLGDKIHSFDPDILQAADRWPATSTI